MPFTNAQLHLAQLLDKLNKQELAVFYKTFPPEQLATDEATYAAITLIERTIKDSERMRAEWRAAGGEIHGPHVEHVSMSEQHYFAFRNTLERKP